MKSAIKVAVPIAVLSTLHGCSLRSAPEQEVPVKTEEISNSQQTASHTHSRRHDSSKTGGELTQQVADALQPVVNGAKEAVKEQLQSGINQLEQNLPEKSVQESLQEVTDVVKEDLQATEHENLPDKIQHLLTNKKIQACISAVGLALVGFFAKRHLHNFINKLLGRPTESNEPSLQDDAQDLLQTAKDVANDKTKKEKEVKKAAPKAAAKKDTAKKGKGKKN